MSEEQAVVVINATIYNWQKEELRKRQETLGVFSLSEALRNALSEVLTRPTAEPAESRGSDQHDRVHRQAWGQTRTRGIHTDLATSRLAHRGSGEGGEAEECLLLPCTLLS